MGFSFFVDEEAPEDTRVVRLMSSCGKFAGDSESVLGIVLHCVVLMLETFY